MRRRLSTAAGLGLWLVDVADLMGGRLLDRLSGYRPDVVEAELRARLSRHGRDS